MADGGHDDDRVDKDLNDLRIRELMTTRPTVINPATSIRDAAQIMTRGHFRHLPVCGDSGLAGIIDITDIRRALIDPDVSQRGRDRRPGIWHHAQVSTRETSRPGQLQGPAIRLRSARTHPGCSVRVDCVRELAEQSAEL